MPEHTLYRYDAINGHPEDIEVAVRRSDGTLVGLFVPVERCEHGNIDPHDLWKVTYMVGDDVRGKRLDEEWCPGAAFGDTDV